MNAYEGRFLTVAIGLTLNMAAPRAKEAVAFYIRFRILKTT
jgi:hypothetical protein